MRKIQKEVVVQRLLYIIIKNAKAKLLTRVGKRRNPIFILRKDEKYIVTERWEQALQVFGFTSNVASVEETVPLPRNNMTEGTHYMKLQDV